MNQHKPSPTKKAYPGSNQAPVRRNTYVPGPLGTYVQPTRNLDPRPSATAVLRGGYRRSSPESCLTGFKKLLSHGSRTRSYGGRSAAALQRHKHHIGHDLVLNTARRRLSRAFAYVGNARLRLVSALAAGRHDGGVSCARGRLAYVARTVEGFYEPSLTRLGWYRGLRHARQAHRHADHGTQLSVSLRAGVRTDADVRTYSGAQSLGSGQCPTIARADRARWTCAPGSVFVVSSSRIRVPTRVMPAS